MERRRFLQAAAGTAALSMVPAVASCEPPEPNDASPDGRPPVDATAFDGAVEASASFLQLPFDPSVFALGVQSGSTRGDQARVWTFANRASRIKLRVWRQAATDTVLLVRDTDMDVDDDGIVRVLVDGLAPATLYNYAFFRDDGTGRSDVGRFRTAFPADWRFPVTIGVTSCTSLANAPFRALEQMAAEELDLFVHCGDWVYADGSSTDADYRTVWRQALNDPGYRALLPRVASIATWDDHEFENNFDPETIPTPQREAATTQFYRHTTMESVDGHLWQSFRWGETLEIFVLDCRTERKPSTRNSDNPVYLSREQMDWLKKSLQDSPCRFKAVMNSVPMTRMAPLWLSQSDRWQGYEVPRRELLEHMEQEAITGVWFLSGDFHVGFAARVEASGFHADTYEVAAGPGGNNGNPLGPASDQENLREQIFPSGQFFYGAGTIASTVMTFDPVGGVVRVRFTDVDGNVLIDREFASGA
jgi:alkaline phosphatase D